MLDQRIRTAVHKAGHACISWLLGLPSGPATIKDGATRAYLEAAVTTGGSGCGQGSASVLLAALRWETGGHLPHFSSQHDLDQRGGADLLIGASAGAERQAPSVPARVSASGS
jgi:hypothetical protein